SFLGDRMTADLAWFDNRFRNLIELVSRPDFSGQFQNIGRNSARGLEFRTRARVRQLLLQANYTYIDGHIEQSSQLSFPFRPVDPLLRRPRHQSDLTATGIGGKWTARWSTHVVGRRADSDFSTYSVPLTSNPGYFVSDLASTYEFARPVSVFIRLENVFDRSYQEVLGYLALGRSIVVGTRIRIGHRKSGVSMNQ